MTNQYDVLMFDAVLALFLAAAFLFILGLAAAVVESFIPRMRRTLPAVRCRLRYWRLRWQERRQKPALYEGESLWSRITALRHEHDSEHVIGGKPRW